MESHFFQHSKKLIKWVLIVLAAGALVTAYHLFNPVQFDFFPKCPFKTFTGYDCPGCGSQRAIHNLLNFNIPAALRENLLLVVSIPYILAGFFIDLVKNPSPLLLRFRKRSFGAKAIWLIFTVIILFWIGRNLFTFYF